MKIMIEIPDEEYEDVKKAGGCYYDFGKAIFYGIPLPKFATNGDVICTLWNVSVVYEKGCYRIIRGGERWSSILKFSEEWWNAPYKAESENGYDYECSECGRDVIDKTPYCSDCGANMESEDISQQLKAVKVTKMEEDDFDNLDSMLEDLWNDTESEDKE